MFTYLDLQNEVKKRAIRNQSGTEYDTEIKNLINTSMFRIAREAKWRSLRCKTYFTTKSTYSSGTGYVLVTNSSTAFSLTSTACDLYTDKIEVGRRINFGTSSWDYTIRAINSNTNGVLDLAYRGTTSTATTYEIYPQSEYNLPIQVDHRAFLWHEDFGYPFRMYYIPEQSFLNLGNTLTAENTPTHYRMWGENCVMAQPPTATPLTITLSSSTDATVEITISGKVGGYPHTEVVAFATGATSTNTGYEFESVDKISKDSSTVGTVTVTSSQGGYTVAVIPTGDTTGAVKYSKVQIYPLPTRDFDINVYYYKTPYRLVNDNDIHELGQEFDECIILLTVAKIKLQDAAEEGASWYKLYQDELKSLKANNIDKIDWLPLLQRPGDNRTDPYVTRNLKYSQAGAYYGPRVR